MLALVFESFCFFRKVLPTLPSGIPSIFAFSHFFSMEQTFLRTKESDLGEIESEHFLEYT